MSPAVPENRLQVYADLGVAEVWVYDGNLWSSNNYKMALISPPQQVSFFHFTHLNKIARFLQQAG